MYYYKTVIQYIGTHYAGFQWQSGIKTVQGALNDSLHTFLDGKVTTMGASRTDTGVHAKEQIVKITTEREINLTGFCEKLNTLLPEDVRCQAIELCPGTFRPASSALSKEYRYLFTNKTQVTDAETRFIANIANPLNFEAMNKCLKALKGTHDFCNFYSSGSNVKSTIRTILSCELESVRPHELFSVTDLFQVPQELGTCYQIKIEADGFLKQMIRHIVSGLWMTGSGKISPEEFVHLLEEPKSNKQLWKVAPPNGLYLWKNKPN